MSAFEVIYDMHLVSPLSGKVENIDWKYLNFLSGFLTYMDYKASKSEEMKKICGLDFFLWYLKHGVLFSEIRFYMGKGGPKIVITFFYDL